LGLEAAPGVVQRLSLRMTYARRRGAPNWRIPLMATSIDRDAAGTNDRHAAAQHTRRGRLSATVLWNIEHGG